MNSPELQNTRVHITGLSKIFGPSPKKILDHIGKGCTKEEILEKTGHMVALNDVSFSVREGEIFVLMGLSGCGKSTLLRCINRLIEPTSGSISIDGEEITTYDAGALLQLRRHKIGMIFQSFALLPHRTVLENVAFGLEIQGLNLEERTVKAQEALTLVGLEGYGDAMPEQLSGGMKQRVGLARALASNADIILMDEAFSALDPLIRRDMQDELLDLQERLNKTIIFVSHDLDEALKLGSRIALMKDGAIVQIGTPEEILMNPTDDYVARFVADVDRAKVLVAEDVMKPPHPVVHEEDGPRVALHLMEEWGISSIFVVGRQHELKGLVMVEDAIRAKKERLGLKEIIVSDPPAIPLGTAVAEIIGLIADKNTPLAVVGEGKRLRGIIVRGSVLAALACKEVEEDGS
jgi:glycine betaine/proline transport system ATP-binding protein